MPKLPKFKFPSFKKVAITKKESKMPSLTSIAKGSVAVATVGTVGYLGYQGAKTGGEIIQSFSPGYTPTKKEAAKDPNINPPPEQTTNWSPEDWANFFEKTRMPYDPNAPTGTWDRIAEGIGDVPESIGKNMIPLAIIAAIVIVGSSSRKHGKK